MAAPHLAPLRDAEGASDAELVDAARRGETGAFDELYRRHSGAALVAAQAVVRNPHDAADAVADAFAKLLVSLPATRDFRSYLAVTARNSARDIVRRSRRAEPTDRAGERPAPGVAALLAEAELEPPDALLAREDGRVIAEAYSRLPDRWRRALWLIDVEQRSTRDAGAVLGVSPNNAAQLAVRARSRLRAEYFQAHVRNHARPDCAVTLGLLGGYVAGSASARARRKVDLHLSRCEDCRGRVSELADVAGVLRRSVLPLPVAVAAWGGGGPLRALRDWAERLLGRGSAAGGSPVGEALGQVAVVAPTLERLVGGASAAALAVGLSVLAVGTPDPGRQAAPPRTTTSVAVALPPAGGPPPVRLSPAVARAGPTVTAMPGRGPVPAVRAPTGPLGGAGAMAETPVPGASTLPSSPPADGVPAPPVAPGLEGLSLPGAVMAVGDPSFSDLAGLERVGRALSGVDLPAVDLPAVDLPAVDLPAVDLPRVTLSGPDGSGADLAGASVGGTALGGAVAGLLPPPGDSPLATAVPVGHRGGRPASLAAVLGIDQGPPRGAPLALPALARLVGGAAVSSQAGGSPSPTDLAARLPTLLSELVGPVPDRPIRPVPAPPGDVLPGPQDTLPTPPTGLGLGQVLPSVSPSGWTGPVPAPSLPAPRHGPLPLPPPEVAVTGPPAGPPAPGPDQRLPLGPPPSLLQPPWPGLPLLPQLPNLGAGLPSNGLTG
ncbi:MAG: sigma-70 family RNA polymerase sigma factor [Actinomycetota bacterium]